MNKKYTLPKLLKKLTVYTWINYKADGSIECMDVTLDHIDELNQVVIARELCGLYQFTLTLDDAYKQLYHERNL